MQTNDLSFNLTTFLQLLHFLCNKSGDFRDKYKDIIPNRISCKVAVYEDTFCQRELGEHDERFWSHRKALPAPCLKLENWIKKRLKHDPHGNKSVGANSVRPFRSPTQLHEKSKPRNSPETGCRISVSLRTEISPSPYNSEIITNSEHERTSFTPTVIRDSLFLRKIAPLFAYLHCA